MIAQHTQHATARQGASAAQDAWRALIASGQRYLSGRKWRTGSGRQRSRERERGAALRGVEQDLAGFSGSVEGVFLQAGEQLMELQLRAREIASQTTSIAELLSNDEGSLVVLDEVLKTAGDDRRDHEIVGSIGGIHENSKAIHHTIESFGRLVNTFDVLGMMTRIESARFESAGGTFVGLADAVMTLSRQIREHIDATARSAKSLLETTSRAGDQVRRVSRIRHENLGPLARQAGVGIQKLAVRRGQVSQANAQIAARSDGVSRAIGDLVTALQSHDIVRQQIEHVVEALQRLGPLEHSSADLCATARLQAAQLDNARAIFQASIEQIRGALARIEQNIEEVAGDSASLLGPSDESEASFISGVESNLAAIVAVLDSNADADRLLAEAVQSVDQRVPEIARTMAGIQTIGIEMQRIALNATIQAARLGEDGGALEIVANAVQGLAREAGSSSSEIEERLKGIRDDALALDTAAATSCSATQIQRLRCCASGLKSIQDQARDGHLQTVEKIAELKLRIGGTISAFGGQSDILERLEGAARLLHELSSEGRPAVAPSQEQIEAAYTMQAERDVHKALFDTATPQNDETPLPGTAPAATEGQEDNVEFF